MKTLSLRSLLNLLGVVLMTSLVMGTTSCKEEDPIVEPPVVILDGYYVKGAATAYTDFNAKAMMKVTKNEVNQLDRAQLMELYIPIKATDGFNIVKVAGSTNTVYGPGANWAEVTAPTGDEPHSAPFWRGAVTATSVKFTVPEDGFYHVIFDTELNIAVVARVHWGVIGAATANGWGGSTDLTESAFNTTVMSWTATNMELRGGDWKFRYSNGWKVEVDPTVDLGGGVVGVKVNTNFGGTLTALTPGGANIVNAAPGVYSLTFTYTLGTGYVLTLTKTGDLPLTNWTGVVCDAVGTGVSADNPSAIIPDPSSWNWGNKLIASNGGVPTKVGDVYTWIWTYMVIEANEGFKLRTENGVAPTTGGANFDAGFGAVNTGASSANVIDLGGNLGVNTKGSYTITLTIDAANSDAKTITITQ